MKYIIYSSTASIYFQLEKLELLLTGFRRSNLKYGVTGMLIYSGGTFMQYIEGPKEAVDRLIKNIVKDKTHHSMMIWENRNLSERLFAGWSMSFKSVSITQFRIMMGLAGGRTTEITGPTLLSNYLTTLIHQPGD